MIKLILESAQRQKKVQTIIDRNGNPTNVIVPKGGRVINFVFKEKKTGKARAQPEAAAVEG
jgi:hypothetical protein